MPEPIGFRIRANGPQGSQICRLAETLGVTEAAAVARCLERGLLAMTRAVDRIIQARRR